VQITDLFAVDFRLKKRTIFYWTLSSYYFHHSAGQQVKAINCSAKALLFSVKDKTMNAAFSTPEWARCANIYEVNLRQYTEEGTFNAFAQSIPRLKDMGVTMLWFMPIHPIGKLNRIGTLGSYYSISDYRDVNPEYGTLDDFRQLVQTAQQAGMKVLIDWVANHTAWDHVWTKTHPAFYVRNGNGDFLSPYDWSDVIQIDHQNIDQQDAMINAMRFWLEQCNIDGFRCDMAHLVPLSFWYRARKELDAVKPLFWLAETEEPAYHQVFDASYTWEFLHKMEQFWRGQANITGLDSVLYKYNSQFPPDAIRLYFTSNHDENSHSGSEYERMGDAAQAFAVFCAMWNGIPLVYSGQELPFTGRLNFYNKDVIPWNGQFALHSFYRSLLTLHSNHPALRAGDSAVETYRIMTSEDNKIFAFLRSNGEREVLVFLNLSGEDHVSFTIEDEQVKGIFSEIFLQTSTDFDSTRQLVLQAWQYFVFSK
jgi:glycosidase